MSATSRSEVTTTTGRPTGSARTRRTISSSASWPERLKSTRTPRGAATPTGLAVTAVASNTTVISLSDARPASAPSPDSSRARCACNVNEPYPRLVTL